MPPLIFLQQRWPVQQHRDGDLRVGLLRRRGGQKAFAVAGHLQVRCVWRNGEQRLWNPGLEGGIRGHLDRHQFPVLRGIKQLLAVTAPERRKSARLGDLPFPSRRGRSRGARQRKRTHINFKSAGLERGVCDPTPVGRKAALACDGFSAQKGNRLAVAIQRQHPYLRFRIVGGEQQKAPIPGPTGGYLVLVGLEQQLILTRAVYILLVQVKTTAAAGRKYETAPVRGPERIPFHGRSKREPRAYAPRELIQPNIKLRV